MAEAQYQQPSGQFDANQAPAATGQGQQGKTAAADTMGVWKWSLLILGVVALIVGGVGLFFGVTAESGQTAAQVTAAIADSTTATTATANANAITTAQSNIEDNTTEIANVETERQANTALIGIYALTNKDTHYLGADLTSGAGSQFSLLKPNAARTEATVNTLPAGILQVGGDTATTLASLQDISIAVPIERKIAAVSWDTEIPSTNVLKMEVVTYDVTANGTLQGETPGNSLGTPSATSYTLTPTAASGLSVPSAAITLSPSRYYTFRLFDDNGGIITPTGNTTLIIHMQ